MADRTARRLCSVCDAIFTAPAVLETSLTAPHHSDTVPLRAAVARDCYICTRIWRQILRRSDDLGRVPSLSSLRFWLAPRDDHRFELNFDVHTGHAAFRLSFLGIGRDGAAEFGIQGELAPSTRTTQSLHQARKWIHQCCTRHEYCRRVGAEKSLPTRLVSVKRGKLGPELLANICEGASLPPSTPYLTLSHRWGHTKFLTLSKQNCARFQNHIPVSELSATFQDALYATVELGYQHIWIDSLCIVQDDVEDWLNQSTRMGEVYKNATCNLSVAGFEDGADGFLQRYSNPAPPSVKPQWSALRSTTLRRYSGKKFVLCETFPWLEIWQAPLFDRAWVLQEQILAQRALHFGTDQIFWECSDRLANEVWPVGWAPRGLSKHPFQELLAISLKMQPFWLFSLDKLNGFKNNPPYDIWRKIVENYSIRKLTLPTDRLPALNGIASEFSKILKDKYLFGLWKNDLHVGLLWRQARPITSIATKDIPANDTCIPSWSWVSLGQPVQWMFPCSEQLEIHSGFTERLSEILSFNETASRPSIRVRGNLMVLSMLKNAVVSTYEPSQGRISLIENDGFAFNFDIDEHFFQQSSTPPSSKAESQEYDQQPFIKPLLSSICFLPMLYTQDVKRMGALGLLLKRQQEHGIGAYSRVGTANMWSDFSKVNRNDFGVNAWYYQHGFVTEDFLENDRKGKYEILII